jgi:hypothetical protein
MVGPSALRASAVFVIRSVVNGRGCMFAAFSGALAVVSPSVKPSVGRFVGRSRSVHIILVVEVPELIVVTKWWALHWE